MIAMRGKKGRRHKPDEFVGGPTDPKDLTLDPNDVVLGGRIEIGAPALHADQFAACMRPARFGYATGPFECRGDFGL